MVMTQPFKYNEWQYMAMEQIHTFAKKVQKAGRVTIPEPVRILLDIQEYDLMYFAVSDKPFTVELIEQ